MQEKISELIKDIGATLYEQILPGETSVWAEVCMIEGHYEEECSGETTDGKIRSFGDDMRDLDPDFEELRSAMYASAPGQGAWYVARVTVSAEGRVTAKFDYDDKSKFHVTPADEEFEEDLQLFPRTNG